MKLKKIIFYLSIILILSGCGENSPNDNNNSNSNSLVSDNNNAIRIEKITTYLGEEKSNSPMATTTFEYDNKQRRVAMVMDSHYLSYTIKDTYQNNLLTESYTTAQDKNNTWVSLNYQEYIYDNENSLKEILHYRKHTYLDLKEEKWLEQKDHKLEKNSNNRTTQWESLHYDKDGKIKRKEITNITYDGNNMTRKLKDTFENETLISTTISDFSYDNKKILPFGNTPCIDNTLRKDTTFAYCSNHNNIISSSKITSNFDSRRADDSELITTDYIYNDNDLPLSSVLRIELTFYQEYQYNIN